MCVWFAATSLPSDAVVRPVCEAGHTAQLLNEILVQVGLLKVRHVRRVCLSSLTAEFFSLVE